MYMYMYTYIYTYTYTTLNPNPLMHVNTKYAWIGELATKLPYYHY
jgi:hypothetical protein